VSDTTKRSIWTFSLTNTGFGASEQRHTVFADTLAEAVAEVIKVLVTNESGMKQKLIDNGVTCITRVDNPATTEAPVCMIDK
jgi:TRAP-type C4-dicarboxylate transport system substrate-binding protein